MVKRVIGISLLLVLLGRADEALSVRALAIQDGEMPTWYVAVADEKYEPLTWPANQPSAVIETQASGVLQLFSKVANAEGGEEFQVVEKVTIPKAAREVLLIGTPDDEDDEDGEAKVKAYADLFQKAKFDDWLVINLSEQKVSLHLGSEGDAIQLEADEAKIYKPVTKVDKGGKVIAQAMRKGEMKIMYSTFWAASAKQRSLVLFYPQGDRVKLRRISDFLPAKK